MPDPRLECYLIGAPGSGKTEIAQAFEEASRGWFVDHGVMPLSVVDTNDRIEGRQGRPSGINGDHYVTMANYFNRANLEDRIRARGDSFISCGCIIDSAAHVNVRLKALGQSIQTETTGAMVQREALVANLLQTYLGDGRWQINFAWYAPLPPQVVLPGITPDTYASEVDAIIRDLNIKIPLGIPPLEGNLDQKVAQMLADLDKFYVDDRPVEGDRFVTTGDGGTGGDGS